MKTTFNHLLQKIMLLLFITLAAFLTAQPVHAAVPGDLLYQWGARYHFTNEHGVAAYGVALDKNGTVYVADTGYDNVHGYYDGRLVLVLGEPGWGGQRFSGPRAVAVDDNGYLYVADTGNGRVVVFTPEWEFVREMGPAGDCTNLAVDGNGNVYALDRAGKKVNIFNSAGDLVRTIGTTGVPNPLTYRPVGLAVDGSGAIYVVDATDAAILVFNSEGAFLRQFGVREPGEVQNPLPAALALGAGRLYVACYDGTIKMFSTDGAFVGSIRNPEHSDLSPWRPEGVAVDGSGTVYVADTVDGSVKIFASDGTLSAKWASSGSGHGEFNSPAGMTIDSNHNLYVADVNNRRIEVFSSDGTYLRTIGAAGSDAERLGPCYGVAVDKGGTVFVADTFASRVAVFAGDGRFLRAIGAGELKDPVGVAVDGSGQVYVADTGNDRVQVYSNTGAFLRTIGSSGEGEGQFHRPHGLILDASGNLYVADQFNHRIQVFNSAGVFLRAMGSFGTYGGQFNNPNNLALDKSGNLYVTDSANDRIVAFTTGGTYVGLWGATGSGDSAYHYPRGVAADGNGNVFVSDGNNNRIQVHPGYGVQRFEVSAPSATTAGSAFAFTIKALDWLDQPLTGYTGTVNFSSSDGSATLPGVATLLGGVATFTATLRSTGNQTITVTEMGIPSITGSSAPIGVAAAPSQLPDLKVGKSHKGDFKQGERRAVYTIKVTNAGAGPTSGQVKVVDALPRGLAATSISGYGWNCSLRGLACTRSSKLAPGASYPPIVLTVDVSQHAPRSVTNVVYVSGGGEVNRANNTAKDWTLIKESHHGWRGHDGPGGSRR